MSTSDPSTPDQSQTTTDPTAPPAPDTTSQPADPTAPTGESEELTPEQQEIQKQQERNKELLALSGSAREEKRAEFAKEDAEAGVTATPEEQRIQEDEATAAPVGHIPAG